MLSKFSFGPKEGKIIGHSFAKQGPDQSSTLETGALASLGRRLNGFLGLSLNDRTIIFLGISLDRTVSVG